MRVMKTNLSEIPIRIMRKKSRGRAIREPIFGKVVAYSKSKTVGIRNPITEKIVKRVKKR